MSFQKKLESYLVNKKLTDSSKSLYINNIIRLYNQLGFNDNSLNPLVKHKDIVVNYIDHLKTNSVKRSYYNSIYKFIENKNNIDMNIKEFYFEKLKQATHSYNDEKLDNNTKNELIPYKDLFNIPNLILNQIQSKYHYIWLNKSDFNNLSIKDKREYSKLISQYIFVLMNINYPLRLELFNIRLIRSDKKTLPDRINFILIDKNFIKIYLNDYKTISSYGKKIIDLPNNLVKILNLWFNEYSIINDGRYPIYLLYKFNSSGINSGLLTDFNNRTNYSQYLKKILELYSGKPIGMNQIRDIITSEFIQSKNYNNLTNREKEEHANLLLHSSRTANESYNKI